MEHTVSFPGLGLEFHLNRAAFWIGDKPIYWYGIIIAVGFVLGFLYITKKAKRCGIRPDDASDLLFIALPVAIVCARLYYVIFQWKEYAGNPAEIIAVWHGGLAIYGGVIGGALTVIVFCKVKKLRIADMLDTACLGLMLGQSIGRWGNFVNAEAFGSETAAPWRMCIDTPLSAAAEIGVHPTFFYESAWNLIGFVLIHFFTKKRTYHGQVVLCYLAWYGLGRFFIEGLRMDSLYLFGTGLRVSQVLAGVTCLAAAAVLAVNRVHPILERTEEE